jgi:hypothetical protein
MYNKSLFKVSNEDIKHKVALGNNVPLKAKGMSDVSITMQDGKEKIIYNVLYVPCIKKNLLSIPRIS